MPPPTSRIKNATLGVLTIISYERGCDMTMMKPISFSTTSVMVKEKKHLNILIEKTNILVF